jgi:hypothetical protein
VLHFVAPTAIPVGGTFTLTMPAGYFHGYVSNVSFSVSSTAVFSATSSASTQIVLIIGHAPVPASVAVIVTLFGLNLGTARAETPSGFKLSSSVNTTSISNGRDAPGIVSSAGGINGDVIRPASLRTSSHVHYVPSPPYERNSLRFSFETRHLCSLENVTRSCLLANSLFSSG